MTVTLNLPPNIEQLYLAEAKARGLALKEVIAQTLVAAWKREARGSIKVSCKGMLTQH